jgi:hypothetical protein
MLFNTRSHGPIIGQLQPQSIIIITIIIVIIKYVRCVT